MDFMKFLMEQGVIIAAALYVLGIFIKMAPFIPDWAIPFVLTGLGVAAAGFSIPGGFTVENILQGVFAAGAAVLAHQMGKQAVSRDVGDAFAGRQTFDLAEPDGDEDEAAETVNGNGAEKGGDNKCS